jgi:hypothetical protein
MSSSSLGVAISLLLAVSPAQAGETSGVVPLPVGERVRVQIASEYEAGDVVVGERRLVVRGKAVEQDDLTFTVTSVDGDEVRYPASKAILVGRLAAPDEGGLMVDLDDGKLPVRVPQSAVKSLAISRGGTGRQKRGAKIGALALGLPLALVGSALVGLGNLDCESGCDSVGPLVAGGMGLAVGAGVGIALSGGGERWEKVSVAVGVRRSPRTDVAVALSLRF